MSGLRNFVTDSEGNQLYTPDLAQMYGTSVTYINRLFKGHRDSGKGEINTLAYLVKVERNHKVQRSPGKRKVVVYDRSGATYSVKEAALLVNCSSSYIHTALKHYSCHTLEDLIASKGKKYSDVNKKVQAKKALNRRVDKDNFDRRTTCYRDDCYKPCIHYSECQDFRLKGMHHERYQEDGSCYHFDDLPGVMASNSTVHSLNIPRY